MPLSRLISSPLSLETLLEKKILDFGRLTFCPEALQNVSNTLLITRTCAIDASAKRIKSSAKKYKTTVELQKQIDSLQGQIIDIHQTQGTTGENPNLSSEVQSLKEKLDEHSKQLELSVEKLSQLQSENTALRDQNQTLNVAGNKKRRLNTRVQPMGNLNTPSTGEGTTDTPPASGVAGATQEGTENPQIHDLEESDSEPEPGKEEPEKAATESSITTYLEQMFSRRFDAMQSMVERLPGVAPPIRRSNPDSYADTPFAEEIASVEMPRKFSFPSIKMYDDTGDPNDHIAQYKQRMLAVALPKESHEATMCKGFGSTLIGPALQWYINLPTRSISSFAGLSDKFVSNSEVVGACRRLPMVSTRSSSIEWNPCETT
ncbi:hypothetical protein Bca4012_073839 [Brassica carinata]